MTTCPYCGTTTTTTEETKPFDISTEYAEASSTPRDEELYARNEAHTADWKWIKGLAESIGKHTTGDEWQKAKALRKLIKGAWPEFAFLKYGKDRGLDCKQLLSREWNKSLTPEAWYMLKFADNEAIIEAIEEYES